MATTLTDVANQDQADLRERFLSESEGDSESPLVENSQTAAGNPEAFIQPNNNRRAVPAPAPIVVRAGSVAIQTGLLGLHLSANSKMLSMLREQETGAAAVVTTFQSVIIGTAASFLLATGIEIGKPIGAGNFIEAGHLARSSFVLAVGLGGLSTILMVATPLILPAMASQQASDIAIDFFKGYAACGIPSVIIMCSPNIAFQAGEWWVPSATGLLFYVPAGISSYALAFPGGMGASGIGWGGTIGGWLSTIGIQLWLRREYYSNYQFYQLHQWSLKNLLENICLLSDKGLQLALQRFTEWGNLFAITTVISACSQEALSATPPAIQYTAIFALSMQGFAQAGAMVITQNRRIATTQNANRTELNLQNRRALVLTNIAGAVLGIPVSIFCYTYREALASFFLSSDTSPEIKAMAETYLWINMLTSIPDAIRIISLGALRGWDDIYRPTFACLALMTALGVPVGYGASEAENDDWSYMFVVRNIVMVLSAMGMAWRCWQKIQADRAAELDNSRLDNVPQIQNLEDPPEENPRIHDEPSLQNAERLSVRAPGSDPSEISVSSTSQAPVLFSFSSSTRRPSQQPLLGKEHKKKRRSSLDG